MRAYLNISKYWPEGYTVNRAYKEIYEQQGFKVNQITLTAAKKGRLVRCELITLIKIRDWLREKTGNENLSIEDLIVIKSG